MDLMKIIRSFEEFIYEVMTWLLFYPRTLFRILRNPVGMLDYAIAEQADEPEEQYTDALSPPLFLTLTVALCYLIERTTHLMPIPGATGLLAQLMKSTESTLATRSLLYAIFPLVFATEYIRMKRMPLTRQTLRPAFFSQCFAAGGFVLQIAVGAMILRLHGERVIGVTLITAGVLWYVTANTLWFRKALGVGTGQAALLALRGFGLAVTITVGLITGIAATTLKQS